MAKADTGDHDGGADDAHLDAGKIRTLREALGLTQEQAGAGAGFKNGRQAWNHFESGRQSRITLSTLWKLAAVLRVEARDLLKPGPVRAEPPVAADAEPRRKRKA